MTSNKLKNKTSWGETSVDEETGLPADYDSFFAAYRPLMLATAARAKIPAQDREDAVHEVQIKFWQKNGLEMYDPERGTKFATLLRNWAGLFMLQELDKVKRNNARYHPYSYDSSQLLDSMYLGETPEDIDSEVSASAWVNQAETALEASGKVYLLPVLNLCVEAAEANKAPTRAQIAASAGVKINKATPLLKELRKTLTDYGLGMESLYNE